MKPGATVILRNAKIDMFKGTMRLAVDKWGLVEVTEPANFEVKEDNNLSLVEYELVNVTEEWLAITGRDILEAIIGLIVSWAVNCYLRIMGEMTSPCLERELWWWSFSVRWILCWCWGDGLWEMINTFEGFAMLCSALLRRNLMFMAGCLFKGICKEATCLFHDLNHPGK